MQVLVSGLLLDGVRIVALMLRIVEFVDCLSFVPYTHATKFLVSEWASHFHDRLLASHESAFVMAPALDLVDSPSERFTPTLKLFMK
jgi:hypothetical protein